MKGTISFGAIGVGVVLLLMSGLWSSLFPATASWTDEKSVRRAEVQDRIHNLRFRLLNQPTGHNFHSHAPIEEQRSRAQTSPGALQAELDELTKENEQLNAEFQRIRDRPNTIASVLKWSGLSLAALGIIGWYATKEA